MHLAGVLDVQLVAILCTRLLMPAVMSSWRGFHAQQQAGTINCILRLDFAKEQRGGMLKNGTG